MANLALFGQAGPPTREEAIELLARRLHWKMEHLELTDDPDREALTERQREFYRVCVSAIFQERCLARIVMG